MASIARASSRGVPVARSLLLSLSCSPWSPGRCCRCYWWPSMGGTWAKALSRALLIEIVLGVVKTWVLCPVQLHSADLRWAVRRALIGVETTMTLRGMLRLIPILMHGPWVPIISLLPKGCDPLLLTWPGSPVLLMTLRLQPHIVLIFLTTRHDIHSRKQHFFSPGLACGLRLEQMRKNRIIQFVVRSQRGIVC